MASQYQYFGSGSHMSAVLKQDVRRVRNACPERYVSKRVEIREFADDGSVKVVGVSHVADATPMSPRRRHALSLQVERY